MQIPTKQSCEIIMHHQKKTLQTSQALNTNSPSITLKDPNGLPEKADSLQTQGLIRTHQQR